MTDDRTRERHVERLVGCRVFDRDGASVGRIEELHAEKDGDGFALTAIDLGPVALLERLAVRHLRVTWGSRAHGYRARWDQIDLENERRPTLTCDLDDLEVLRPGRRHRTR